MNQPRIENLRRMLEKHPDDPRLRFGLALEYEKAKRWAAMADELQRYLELADDEGNAWGRLGTALRQLGKSEEARAAYRKGIDAATRHGHPTMAADFQDVLEQWDD